MPEYSDDGPLVDALTGRPYSYNELQVFSSTGDRILSQLLQASFEADFLAMGLCGKLGEPKKCEEVNIKFLGAEDRDRRYLKKNGYNNRTIKCSE